MICAQTLPGFEIIAPVRKNERVETALRGHWLRSRDGDLVGAALYHRHYSAHQYADGRLSDPNNRNRNLFVGPGYKMVLIKRDLKALFVWRKFIDKSGQQGINCAVFRNESSTLSSCLIGEAMRLAWQRWPGERLYTYVNADAIKSSNPGYCFKQAGWKTCGKTRGGLIILEAIV